MLLMFATGALLAWDLRHVEATAPDGLRSIQQAEQIHRGDWKQGLLTEVDHPLHPLGIMAAHALVGGDGPVSWQRAAVALGFGCLVLLVVPVYLLARDVCDDRTAWLAALFLMIQPLLGHVMADSRSESTFLLFWMWGLWSAFRFLREGRFGWLSLTVALGALAYLARPEGLLLPLSLTATLASLPLCRAARINWPRWRAALSLVILGSMLLAGPYMLMKGGPGTRPAISRVLGLWPSAPAEAIEREQPLPPDQRGIETYRLAAQRMVSVVGEIVPLPLACLAGVGLILLPSGPTRTRTWLFYGWILAISCAGLVRLHATGGYLSARHALIPGSLLLLLAAHGMAAAARSISIPTRLVGSSRRHYRPGPVIWGLLIGAMIVASRLATAAHEIPGPYSVYRDAGDWLTVHAGSDERILDMTDWSLYFSGKAGEGLASFHEASADPRLRWVVTRQPHLTGHQSYTEALRELIGGRSPVLRIPARSEHGRLQVLVYDRLETAVTMAGPNSSGETQSGAAALR